MAQATARILDATCALSSGGLENERTTPRATFRRGQLSLQSNAWQEPNSGEIASSCQLRASICCRTRCFSAVFSAGGLVGVNGTSPLGLVPLEANQIISKDGIVTSGRRLRRCPPQAASYERTLPNRSVSASRRYGRIGCFGRFMVAVPQPRLSSMRCTRIICWPDPK
jgi:hypothetical protein